MRHAGARHNLVTLMYWLTTPVLQLPIGPMVQNDPDEWTHTIAVNLFGTFHCIQAVLPGMMARQRGRIINLSGGGATAPRPNFSAYAAPRRRLCASRRRLPKR